ncbi:hypothetical protein [Phyllobacterium sp. K27]
MESADLQIGKADTLVDDPAVPKERFQGRNYTSLMRRGCFRPWRGRVGPPLLTNRF